MDRKELYDAIWRRWSVRRYLERPIESDKIDRLKETIAALNEASGLTMEFIEETDAFETFRAFTFKNVRSLISVKGSTDDPDLFEKCGYYGEQVVLEATAMGLGTCWVGSLSFKSKSSTLNVKEDETLVCGIPVGYSAESVYEQFKVSETPHRHTITVSEFLGGDATDIPWWVTEAIRAVQFAPTAMNAQGTRFHYKDDGTLTAEIPISKLNMVDLGIAKLHFELAAGGKFPLGTPSEFVRDDTGLAGDPPCYCPTDL